MHSGPNVQSHNYVHTYNMHTILAQNKFYLFTHNYTLEA